MGMQCWNGNVWESEWEWFDGSGKRMGTSKAHSRTPLVSTLCYDGILNVVRCTTFNPKLSPRHTTRLLRRSVGRRFSSGFDGSQVGPSDSRQRHLSSIISFALELCAWEWLSLSPFPPISIPTHSRSNISFPFSFYRHLYSHSHLIQEMYFVFCV